MLAEVHGKAALPPSVVQAAGLAIVNQVRTADLVQILRTA
jgi:hypothetical protein